MSDSDDTDLLLLIPPDYYVVRTPDIEENIDVDENYDENTSIVNDLITQVNQLEDRISVIENSEVTKRLQTVENIYLNRSLNSGSETNFQTFNSSDIHIDSRHDINTVSAPNYRLSSSVDSVLQKHQTQSGAKHPCKSPTRIRLPFSLPGSPTGTIKSHIETPCITVPKENSEVLPNTDIINVDECVSQSSTSLVPIASPVTEDYSNYNKDNNEENCVKTGNINGKNELLNAIDQYLDEVKKGDRNFPIILMNEKHATLNESNPIMNKFLKDDMERINSVILDKKFDDIDDPTKLDLSEVDNLLKEMESTQSEIEKKLKSRESQLSKNKLNENQVSAHKNTWQSGDFVGSIPDLGFGIRDLFAKSNVDNRPSKKPIGEEPCTKKKMGLLTSESKENKFNENGMLLPNTKSHTWQPGDLIGSVPDLGLGIRELYKSSDPLQKQPGNKPYKPVNEQPCVEKKFALLTNINTNEIVDNNDVKAITIPPGKNYTLTPRRRLNRETDKILDESDYKQLSASDGPADVERNRDLSIKTSTQSRFSEAPKFNLRDRGSLSPKFPQRKQFSSEKVLSDNQQPEANRNQYGESGSKNILESTGVHRFEKRHPSDNLDAKGLLSLSDLWNKEPVFHSEDPNKLKQKLEEERYRRQHCEQLIQALQYRLLEQQEKLAVAVHVDQEKDRAIHKIGDGWRKLTKHWTELEDQRHRLAQELQKQREIAKEKEQEISKKVERWNTEIAQALDLAAGYKKKSETMNSEREALKQEMDKKIQEAESKLMSIEEENKKHTIENKKLVEELEETRREAAEEKRLVQEAQRELQRTREHVSQLEAEITVLKEQKQTLTTKLKEEKSRIASLEQQNVTIQQALGDAKKNEKIASDEANMYGERLEVARSELRMLYQNQLETVVKEKLKEFQDQLDTAEVALKTELQTKEKQWSEKAINQCKLLVDKHKEEIQKLEEQFRVEIKAWKMKLSDSEQKRISAESRLQEETNRRSEIASRLHNVMEKQWKQALKIITNSSTGENNRSYPSNKQISERARKRLDTYVAAQNIHSQGSSSTSLTFNEDDLPFEHNAVKKGNPNEHGRKKLDTHIDLNSHGSSTVSIPHNNQEDLPFGREGLPTCRLASTQQDTIKQPEQEQLRKYIQMLLERPPGNPVDNTTESGQWQEQIGNGIRPKSPDLQNLKWDTLMTQDDQKRTTANESKSTRKRPWK